MWIQARFSNHRILPKITLINSDNEALLIVDVQYDFLRGGALAVPDGDSILPVIRKLAPQFQHLIATQDFHPPGHMSFASSHPGKKPFDQIEWRGQMETLWPDHCVQNTQGSDIHADVLALGIQHVVGKGQNKDVDSYSAFFDNHRAAKTELEGLLRRLGITKLTICGLATDFCVLYTVADALELGFSVQVVESGVRAIGNQQAALDKMKGLGAEII